MTFRSDIRFPPDEMSTVKGPPWICSRFPQVMSPGFSFEPGQLAAFQYLRREKVAQTTCGIGGGDLVGVEADLPSPGHAVSHVPVLLPSQEPTPQNVSTTFTWKPRPESGPDCLMCAEFARQRIETRVRTTPEGSRHPLLTCFKVKQLLESASHLRQMWRM